jgi:hypothetical protein
MDTELSTLIDSLPSNTLYVLVRWPFVQELMEYAWFRTECCLHQAFENQACLPSAFFVPLARMHELHNQGDPELFLFTVIGRA